jgi:hypothetical protein
MRIHLRAGTDFLLDDESVMPVTFVEGVKDENYGMAKSRFLYANGISRYGYSTN